MLKTPLELIKKGHGNKEKHQNELSCIRIRTPLQTPRNHVPSGVHCCLILKAGSDDRKAVLPQAQFRCHTFKSNNLI